jgi:hypothetical protein
VVSLPEELLILASQGVGEFRIAIGERHDYRAVA